MPKTLALILLLAACSAAPTESPPATLTPTSPPPGTARTSTYREPVGAATAAEVTVNLAFENATLSAGSDALLDAQIEHVNELDFSTAGEATRSITLAEKATAQDYTGSAPLNWMIALSPDVPLALTLTAGSGTLTLDASRLKLTTLNLDAQSGQAVLDLPPDSPFTGIWSATSGSISARIPAGASMTLDSLRVSSGTVRLEVGADASVSLTVAEIGSGSLVVDVPDDAAVRLEVRSVVSGLVNTAYRIDRLETAGEAGVWQTVNYVHREARITIVIDSILSGTFTLE